MDQEVVEIIIVDDSTDAGVETREQPRYDTHDIPSHLHIGFVLTNGSSCRKADEGDVINEGRSGGRDTLGGHAPHRRRCGKCGVEGHNRVTCGRAAARFRLPYRLCERCGLRGHYSILCPNAPQPIMVPNSA
jgi:hypothetical protein